MDTYSFSIFRLFHAPDSSATPIQMKSSMEFIQCNRDSHTRQWMIEQANEITAMNAACVSHLTWQLYHMSCDFYCFQGRPYHLAPLTSFMASFCVFLCRLRSIATHRDHFVRRPSVSPSVTRHNFQSYVSQATHAFLGMLPLFFLLEQTKLLDAEFEYLRVRCKSLAPFLWLSQ